VWQIALSHPDDKKDVRWWMRQVEDAGPWQRRIILAWHMRLQHLLHRRRHHVKVEVFWHFSSFFDVIQCHRRKYWLNFYLKPATRYSYCVWSMTWALVALQTFLLHIYIKLYIASTIPIKSTHLVWNADNVKYVYLFCIKCTFCTVKHRSFY